MPDSSFPAITWKVSAGVVAAGFFAAELIRLLRSRARQRELARLAARKRAQRDKKEHPLLHGALQVHQAVEVHEKIIMATASELRSMMARGTVTCEQVVLAFSSRSFELGAFRSKGGQTSINCVTEENYDGALEMARRVDSERSQAEWADVQGLPLLGVPVSVKDQVIQKGFDATMGSAVRCFQWGESGAKEDGLHLRLLLEAGAVPFVRSCTQQALMLPESANNIWGTACNPYDVRRTPGGSSGGEGGLVAACCSPLGIGTDIGGSVRIPCHFCGLYGLKPTQERITKKGISVSRKGNRNGQTVIRGVAGPIAKCVEDLALVMRSWLRPSVWQQDPELPRLPFDEKVYAGGLAGDNRPLRVACLLTDGWFDPCPTSERAVLMAAAALRGAGHHVADISLPEKISGWEAARLYIGILAADGNMHGMIQGLDGERLHPMYNSLKAIADLPNVLRPVVRLLLGFLGENRKRHMLSCTRSGGLTVRQYWELVADVDAFRASWIELLREGDFDAVLLPGPGLPALKHGQSKDLNQCCTYTFLFNLLGWPAGICPVTEVRGDEQSYPLDRLPKCQRDSIAKKCAEAMDSSAGLPIGVQLAAPPFQDELVLYAMKQLEGALPFQTMPPMPGLRKEVL